MGHYKGKNKRDNLGKWLEKTHVMVNTSLYPKQLVFIDS